MYAYMEGSLSCSLGVNWEQSAWSWMSPLSEPSVRWAFRCVLPFLVWGLFSRDHSEYCFLDFFQCGESWAVFFLCLGRHVSWIFSVRGELGGFLCLCKESVISPLPCHLASLRTLSILCLSAGITMLVQQLSCGGSRCSRLQCRQQQCGLEQ